MWKLSIPRAAAVVAALLPTVGSPAAAQWLAERVERAPQGAVHFSCPSRPGVCGYGDAIIMRDPDDPEKRSVSIFHGDWRDADDWEDRCVPGPVRVRLDRSGGRVTEVELRVGSPFAGDPHDLGSVSGQEAADYLVSLAEESSRRDARDAIVGAILARDAVVTPRLIRLAMSERAATETRRQAVFWAGQQGAPLADLRRVYDSAPGAVREHVLFAYSQRKEPEAARELLRVARAEGEPRELRKKAVFWLGQAAGRAVTRDLGNIADDRDLDSEVREHAVFALSQRPRDEGVPALIRIARESPDPRLRKRAIFWLGQSGDERALALFQELLGIQR